MIILEAKFRVKGKPGRGLGGGWHIVQSKSHGNRQLYCEKETGLLEMAKVREGIWEGDLEMEGRMCQAEGTAEAKARGNILL